MASAHEVFVVEYYHLAILSHADVAFDDIDTNINCTLEGGQRGLGRFHATAAVCQYVRRELSNLLRAVRRLGRVADLLGLGILLPHELCALQKVC